MCLIMYRPQSTLNKPFPMEWNNSSLRSNNDGVGVMYPTKQGNKKELVVAKLLGTNEEMTEFLKHHWEVSAKLGVPIAVHYRFKTHGKIDEDNTHPHRITDDVYLMHNGTIRDVGTHATKSDTVLLVESELREMVEEVGTKVLRLASFKKMLEARIGIGNKLITMTKNGEINIFNEGQGTWREGIWLSNTYSIGYQAPSQSSSSAHGVQRAFPNYGANSYCNSGGSANRFQGSQTNQETKTKAETVVEAAKQSAAIIPLAKDLVLPKTLDDVEYTVYDMYGNLLSKQKAKFDAATGFLYDCLGKKIDTSNSYYDIDIQKLPKETKKEETPVTDAVTDKLVKNIVDSFRNDTPAETKPADNKPDNTSTTASGRGTSANTSSSSDGQNLRDVEAYTKHIAKEIMWGSADTIEQLLESEKDNLALLADAIFSAVGGCTRTRVRPSSRTRHEELFASWFN